MGGQGRDNHHPLSKKFDFSGGEPPMDHRQVCKLEFVCCDPVEKCQSTLFIYPDRRRGVRTNTFFTIAVKTCVPTFHNGSSIFISPEANLRWTTDNSAKLSLSVVIQ